MLLILTINDKERNDIMKNKDIILTCQKCREKFYFTIGEQNFYKKNGLNIPKYCKKCREKKRAARMIDRTPRACSTCYFFCPKDSWYYTRYGSYIQDGDHDFCKRSGERIINDAPCEHWTKG